jgi:hypothetical protein
VDVKYIHEQKKVIDNKIESLENEFKKTKFFKEHSPPNGAIFAPSEQFVLRKKRQKQF